MQRTGPSPTPERGALIASGCEKQRAAGVPGDPLNGPAQGLAHSPTHALWAHVQSTRDTQGGTELTSFRARQLTLSGGGGASATHCSTHPTNSSPRDLPPTAFHTSCMPWLVLRIFLKFLKGKQTPNKQWLTSACCSTLDK